MKITPPPTFPSGKWFTDPELRARDLEVARVVLEAAAVTAWTHYMDTCKKRGIAPADCEHWLVATPIRALEVHHD